MRWILIIAASVTCLDMSGDLQQKSQIFHFCHPSYDQGCFLFSLPGCELRRVNNQQIRSRNSSNNVKQVTRTTNKEVEMSSLRILSQLKLLTLHLVGLLWDQETNSRLDVVHTPSEIFTSAKHTKKKKDGGRGSGSKRKARVDESPASVCE